MKPQPFYKLVRDKIPKILKLKGFKPITSVLYNESKFRWALINKLNEEVLELQNAIKNDFTNKASIMEEIADVQEVLETIALLHGIELKELAEFKATKKEKKGGFERRFYLEEVREGNDENN